MGHDERFEVLSQYGDQMKKIIFPLLLLLSVPVAAEDFLGTNEQDPVDTDFLNDPNPDRWVAVSVGHVSAQNKNIVIGPVRWANSAKEVQEAAYAACSKIAVNCTAPDELQAGIEGKNFNLFVMTCCPQTSEESQCIMAGIKEQDQEGRNIGIKIAKDRLKELSFRNKNCWIERVLGAKTGKELWK